MAKTWDELNKEAGGVTPTVDPSKGYQTPKTWKEYNAMFENYQAPQAELVTAPAPEPGFAERNFEPLMGPNDVSTSDYAGLTAGRGGGSPFDFHIVTPKFKVTTEEKGLGVAGKNVFNVVSTVAETAFNTMNDLFDFGATNFRENAKAGNFTRESILSGKGLSGSQDKSIEGVALGAKAVGAVAGIAFTPISAELTAAETSGIPVLSQVATVVNKFFGKVAEGGSWVGHKAVDSLPISEQSKEVLRGPIEELAAIAAQLLVAKGMEHGTSSLAKGRRDATKTAPNAEGGFTTVISREPTKTAQFFGMTDASMKIAVAPISETVRRMTTVYKAKVAEKKAQGLDVDSPEVATQIVNETVKEVAVKVPGEMKIVKTNPEGRPLTSSGKTEAPKEVGVEDVIRAISERESSGSYTAVGKPNSKGQTAYGKYQIMDFNIKAWSKEALGQSIDLQTYKNSPQLQERIARYKINQLWEKYGNAEDVASVWFTGQPYTKTKGTKLKDVNGTEVDSYVRDVVRLAGGVSGKGGTGKMGTVENPITVVTDQKLVLQNFIKGQEDINYKTVSDLGATPKGEPITARFEWDYKAQEATMYVTKASTASDLAHELGHYFDRRLTADVGIRMSEMLPDYRNNAKELNATLAAYAVEKLGGNATKSKIDSTVKASVSKFDKEVRTLSKGEKRGYGEKFAEAFREVVTNPRRAAIKAPEFTAFVKFAVGKEGIIAERARTIKGKAEGVKKVQTERATIEDYVKGKKAPKFRTEEEVQKGKDEKGVPEALRPLAKELRQYSKIEQALPEGIKPGDVKKTIVFGSSVRGKEYNDVDVAIFVKPDHPLLKKAGADALPGEITVGNINYSIFADTPANRSLFKDFAKEGKDGVTKEGEFMKEVDSIEKFFKNRDEKFRTEENKQDDLTTKVLKKLGGREKVSKQFIEDLTNSGELKQAERNLIREKLKEFGDEVPIKEFVDSVKMDLLPLKQFEPFREDMTNRYESITLPEDIRGEVQNYFERVYESPIKTEAGGVHFGERYHDRGGRNTPEGYFAHTRIEDLPPQYVKGDKVAFKKGTPEENIRRVIEVQSDLFQKGRLEQEKSVSFFVGDEIKVGKKKGTIIEVNGASGIVRFSDSDVRPIWWSKLKPEQFKKRDVSKLEPYENNWHERIIREEIKRAAEDGKTKLQLPTGETAMKIEGLGEVQRWYNKSREGYEDGSELVPSQLKRGKEIESSDGEAWIITDVLENGKFKAVYKDALGRIELPTSDPRMQEAIKAKARDKGHAKSMNEAQSYPMGFRLEIDGKKYEVDGSVPSDRGNFFSLKRLGKESMESELSGIKESMKESFDISGKVDTSNPIYRFYEKDIPKFLKRIRPDMKQVTDENGVTWWETSITKKDGTDPIEAFRVKDDFMQATGIEISTKQEAEIKKLNRRIFGDDNVKFVEQILTPEGQKALGSYKEEMIKILDGKADVKETFYHEAVHKYMDTMLDMNEQVDLLRAGKAKYKTEDLNKVEEMLAEDFISYAKSREGVTGTIKRIFDKMIARVNKYLGNEDEIQAFYQSILEGTKSKGEFVDGPPSSGGVIVDGTPQKKVVPKPFKGEGITTEAFKASKINAPKDVLHLLDSVAKKNDNFGSERRSATLEEMKEFSYKYLGDENMYKSVPGEIRANIGKMKAAEQTMVDMAMELQAELRATDLSVASKTEMDGLVRKLTKLEQVTEAFSGARTEASHLFSSLKSEVTPGENQIMRELFTEMKKQGLDTAGMDQFFRNKEKAKKVLYETRGEAMVGVWYSFLLSGPSTFLKNVLSTTGSVIGEVASTGIRNPAEALSAIPNLMTGLIEGVGMAREVAMGQRKGAAEIARGSKFTNNEKIPYEFKGPASVLNKMRIVGRLLSASDTVFNEGLRQMELGSLRSSMPNRAELTKLAEQKAKAEGFRGEEATAKVKEYLQNPEVILGDLANSFALRGTYNSDPQGILGAISRGIGEATRSKPALKFLAPFTRVVANVVNRGLDYTPYGYTRIMTGEGLIGGKLSEVLGGTKGERLTTRQSRQQLARATVGTLAMVYAYLLATEDKLSGDGPKNFNKKKQLLDSGWRPNSIKLGGTWVPYQNLGPLALPLALAANAHESTKYNEVKQDDWEHRITGALSGSLSTIFSMSFLSGINNVMDIAKSDDPNKLQRFIGQTVSGVVAPNFVKQVARYFDSTIYDTSNIYEQILADLKITGSLNPRLNVFGEVVKGDKLTALQPVKESSDPVYQFLGKNKLWVPIAGKNTQIEIARGNQRTMTSDEYYRYIQESGPLIKAEIERQMTMISRLKTQEDQQKQIDKIVDRVRSRVKSNIVRDARKQQ